MDQNNPANGAQPPQAPQAPVEPQQPVTPTTPTEPATPSQPAAAQPVTPAQPSQPVDPNALTEQIKNDVSGKIRDEVSKTLLQKIAEGLGLNPKEQEKLPTDPKELAKFVQDNAQKGVQKVLDEKAQAEKTQQEAQQKQLSEGAKRFQTLWSNQYAELAEGGKLPKVVDAQNKNDPGNVARVRLLTKLKQVIDENAAKGIDYVPTLKEIFYEYPDVLRTDTVAGGNAPVSGGGRSTTPNNGLPYDQLHKKSLEDMVEGKYQG